MAGENFFQENKNNFYKRRSVIRTRPNWYILHSPARHRSLDTKWNLVLDVRGIWLLEHQRIIKISWAAKMTSGFHCHCLSEYSWHQVIWVTVWRLVRMSTQVEILNTIKRRSLEHFGYIMWNNKYYLLQLVYQEKIDGTIGSGPRRIS